jgi:hypothetical protein
MYKNEGVLKTTKQTNKTSKQTNEQTNKQKKYIFKTLVLFF